jgi:formylmethanofuran dehydrogenase subunit E
MAKMKCQLSETAIRETIAFHGHSCPGLAIGIRAAEYALREFENTALEDLLCITETDMCGVDGIQFLTGCTFGKGNLIHMDYGKAAFTFHDRKSGRAIRFLLRPEAKQGNGGEKVHQEELLQLLMDRSLEELFQLIPLQKKPPRRARILKSIRCEECGEETMESRTRRFDGKTLCIPCFSEVEQKI